MTKRETLEFLKRYDPHRPACGRWNDAREYLKRGRRPVRGREPESVVLAVKYLKALEACRNDRDRRRVANRWPDLDEARCLAENDGPRRWEVEARILAGQNDGGDRRTLWC